jgi:hypothetical protein
LMALNSAAPSATAALTGAFYGSGGAGVATLEADCFGSSGGVFDLGTRAFGD